MNRARNILLVFLTLIASLTTSNAQVYRFKHLGLESGLPNTFINAINQDSLGYLMVSTGEGLVRFDGIDFMPVSFPDSSSSRYATVIFRDSYGSLWLGCDDGTIYRYGDVLEQIAVNNTRSIEEILESNGYIWVIPQGGSVIKIDILNTDNSFKYLIDNSMAILSACVNTNGELLLGSLDNILVCDVSDSLVVARNIEGFDYVGITAILQLGSSDTYLIGSDGEGVLKVNIEGEEKIISRYDNLEELRHVTVESFYKDSNGFLWVVTRDVGAIQLLQTQEGEPIGNLIVFDKQSGLAGNNVKSFFQDDEGNSWFGLFGDGISLLNSMAYSLFTPGSTPEMNNITYVNQIEDEILWGTTRGYYLFNPANKVVTNYVPLDKYVGGEDIISYFVDDEYSLWIGSAGNGLYKRDLNGRVERFYRSGDTGEDYITDIIVDKQYVWLGSLNGVTLLDKRTGKTISRYNIDNGLPHNNVEGLMLDRDGRCYVSTKTDRMYYIDPKEGVGYQQAIMYGSTINTILSCCQDQEGNIWAASAGNGLFKIFGDSLTSYTRQEMLLSDYCYSVYRESVNRIWVGHDRGFSRIDLTTGVVNTFGPEYAGDGVCNQHAMFESLDGNLFIGTTQGVVMYDVFGDQQVLKAPMNNINYIMVNGVRYPFKQHITLPYKRVYDIEINFSGINLKSPEKVLYQTRLVNWLDEWSSWSNEKVVTYSPRDGKYKFEMRSINENGVMGNTVTFDLTIKKPVWRTWWFILIQSCLLVCIVVVVVRMRERSQKKLEEFLTSELEARTVEVRRQKLEIEEQNIRITDSINYAKKIQTNIFPNTNKIKEAFEDAFIFFRPRDIVSGDFYWFDRVDEGTFVLVCADSTGHGVPGAFMSMIGTTLLQDIVIHQNITKPSEILKMLDKQVFAALNQHDVLDVSNDGMDMVVCKINVNTNHLIFASAMRPVILVLQGESCYIRGNRNSVGGESTDEKYFDDQDYFMTKNDILYLFSDGLPDQFGGVDNKKLKVAKLKKLLESVCNKPMETQERDIAQFFEAWKGDNDQVDDVLLMGIKF